MTSRGDVLAGLHRGLVVGKDHPIRCSNRKRRLDGPVSQPSSYVELYVAQNLRPETGIERGKCRRYGWHQEQTIKKCCSDIGVKIQLGRSKEGIMAKMWDRIYNYTTVRW